MQVKLCSFSRDDSTFICTEDRVISTLGQTSSYLLPEENERKKDLDTFVFLLDQVRRRPYQARIPHDLTQPGIVGKVLWEWESPTQSARTSGVDANLTTLGQDLLGG